MAHTIFRRYHPSDRNACISIFNSNVPHFLAEEERVEFLEWLDSAPQQYWVLDVDGVVVGCGGFRPADDGELVSLHWGVVHNAWHGKRLGELLMLARIIMSIEEYAPSRIQIATSQHTQSFFSRYGFVADSIKRDGFAKGIDLVEMYLTLSPDAVARLQRLWNTSSESLLTIR